MTLLDVAFVFFSNFPSRLTTPELRFDLHCEEEIFASPHPFSEPSFKLSRNLTVYEAFRSLFSKEKTQPRDATIANPLGLGVVDMFTLVHRMFSNRLLCNYPQRTLAANASQFFISMHIPRSPYFRPSPLALSIPRRHLHRVAATRTRHTIPISR
jgi:hypothetical protein